MSTEAKRAPAQKRKDVVPAGDNGSADAPPTDIAGTPVEQRRELLRSMLLQRRFEERTAEA